MPLPLRRIALAAAMGSAALGAFAFGWWGDTDSARRAFVDTAAVEWEPPKAVVTDVSGFAKILAQRSPFGSGADRVNAAVPATAQAAVPASSPPNWRIGGIVTTETNRHLVVLIRRPGENATRVEIRRPGEELPDGSIVRTVEPANATIEREGTIVTIKMFAQN